MAREEPPLLFFGREPTGNSLDFNHILATMGVQGIMDMPSSGGEEAKQEDQETVAFTNASVTQTVDSEESDRQTKGSLPQSCSADDDERT